MKFLDELDATQIDIDNDKWELDSPLRYEADNGTLFTVPAGYVSHQFASIPRLPVVWLMFKRADTNRPGVLHDWLLTQHTRMFADAMLFEALRSEGVGYLRAKSMWAAVRLYGMAKE